MNANILMKMQFFYHKECEIEGGFSGCTRSQAQGLSLDQLGGRDRWNRGFGRVRPLHVATRLG
jgi:hypothetical protein